MSFIQIVPDSEPFWFQPTNPQTGEQYQSQFQVRVLDDETDLRPLRRKYNKTVFHHGQRSEEFDAFGFAADVIDLAIVGWKGIYRAGTEIELPCERKFKLALPERIKIDVMRLCANKEAGELFPDSGVVDPNLKAAS
jgi:hypothetical protein